MKILHIITIIFIVLKCLAIAPVAAWSWWLVLAPSLFVILLGLVLFLMGLFGFAVLHNRVKNGK